MQIKRLEDRLGAELFNRTKANVDLSAAGEGLLGYARRILTLNEEAIGRLAERKAEGVVRLGVMDDYGTFIIAPLLANFLAGYPKIHIEMETGLTSSMPARLGEAYDLVIAMHAEGRGEGEFLRREQAVWASRPFSGGRGSGAAARRALSARLPVPETGDRGARCGQAPWRLAFVSHSLGAVENVAAQGRAVTVVNDGTFPPKLRPRSRSRRHAATASRGHPPASRCQLTGKRASRGSFANEHLEAS